ncbi:MAG: LPXTG cell wall anchor domain-containing protein [Oscillospiraceae bacterium]|nr:LPXTG cell wall anchor domain-containing protein [Oscillospiraceae bacterium]
MCKKLVIIIIIMSLMAMLPVSTNGASNSVSITVEQSYHAISGSFQGDFTYRFYPLDSDAPMPSGSTASAYTFVISGNKSVIIGPLNFEREGIFHYILFQLIENEVSGLTYDRQVYTIEIHVDASYNAYMIVKYSTGEKADRILFVNSYSGGGETNPPPPQSSSNPNTPTIPSVSPIPNPSPIPSYIPEHPETTNPSPGGEVFEASIINDYDLDESDLPNIGASPDRQASQLPQTGDSSNLLAYWLLFCLGFILVVGALVLLICKADNR